MLSVAREFFSHCFLIQALNYYQCDFIVWATVSSLVAIMVYRWFCQFHYIDNLKQRSVLITGCDSGFGEELCIKLDNMGCMVFACCLTSKGVDNLKITCSKNVIPFLLDVRDSTNVQSLVRNVTKMLNGRRLWGLVNNVGVCGAIGPIELLRREDFEEILKVNFLGGIDLMINLIPLMRDKSKEKARIINMSSILGTFHTPYSAPYCISKNAVNTVSDILRVELSNSNIDVIVIEPGAHSTKFVDSIDVSITHSWERLTEEERQKYVVLLGSTFLKIFTSRRLDKVLDAYCHALFSRRPQSRYVVGLDALLMNLASYIPRPLLRIIFILSGILAKPSPECTL